MHQQQQQIIERCKQVIAKARELYGMDLSQVKISFDLRGRAAGKAGGRGYSMPGHFYYVKFNRDMLTREAFNHVLNNTVPHEFAHVICYMNPALGRNHDRGWERVCTALGGNGERCHQEEVVLGRGTTYEYTTDRGHKVRVGDKHHRYVQMGGVLTYRNNKGKISNVSAYSIVGMNGRSLATPIVKKAANDPAVIEQIVRAAPVPKVRDPFNVLPAPVAAPAPAPAPQYLQNRFPVGAVTQRTGESKAATSRRIMLSGFQSGQNYETIIAAMIAACGYDRQLARATFKANAAKVGIPTTFC